MFFTHADKDKIHKILSSAEGNRLQLHQISSEITEIIKLMRVMEYNLSQLQNDFLSIDSRLKSLESHLPTPAVNQPAQSKTLKVVKKK